MTDDGTGEPEPDEEEPPRSGLRNPLAAVRGVGAAALSAEGLVLLLAIVPLRVLGATNSLGGTMLIIGLAVVSFGLAGMLRRRWAWIAGGGLQLIILGCGFVVHPSLAVLGVVFGFVWLYVLNVRRTVLGRQSGR